MGTYVHVCHASGPAKDHLKRAYVGPASNDSKVNNIFIASEASSVTNCANLRFLVYIFIYLYIYMSPYVLFGPAWAPRNAQTSDRPVEVQRSI